MALSGMTTMEQVKENVAIADRSRPNILTHAELQLIDQAGATYRGLNPISCTNCRYCMPCPNDVEIPHVFAFYNDAIVYNTLKLSKLRYNGTDLTKEQRADNCLECGECEDKCPQRIPIQEWLKKVHTLLHKIG